MGFEERMRSLEYFSQNLIPHDMWVIVRLDGNKFSNFTKDRKYEKPFDLRFQEAMAETAEYITEKLSGIFAETHSDEISILFPKDWALFGRRAEKIASISAGMASSKFSLKVNEPVQFDSRICIAASNEDIIKYFKWRQLDSSRNALHGYCFYELIKEGNSPSIATNILNGKDDSWKNNFLFQRGINFNDIENWKKRGIGIYWENYLKSGINPITGEKVQAKRRRLKFDYNLPMKEEYNEFIEGFLK